MGKTPGDLNFPPESLTLAFSSKSFSITVYFAQSGHLCIRGFYARASVVVRLYKTGSPHHRSSIPLSGMAVHAVLTLVFLTLCEVSICNGSADLSCNVTTRYCSPPDPITSVPIAVERDALESAWCYASCAGLNVQSVSCKYGYKIVSLFPINLDTVGVN